jgi:hypothetical protein
MTDVFLDRRTEDIPAEVLVLLGFGRLQESLAESERIMVIIREGFEKLNKDWFRLHTELSKQK